MKKTVAFQFMSLGYSLSCSALMVLYTVENITLYLFPTKIFIFQAFRKSKYIRQFSFDLHTKTKAHNEKKLKKKTKMFHFNAFKHTVLELKLSNYSG